MAVESTESVKSKVGHVVHLFLGDIDEVHQVAVLGYKFQCSLSHPNLVVCLLKPECLLTRLALLWLGRLLGSSKAVPQARCVPSKLHLAVS